MSNISNHDQSLLNQIKAAVEELTGLGDSTSWVQKDYEFLVHYIEEKTGARISLSTLKRIWKNENNRLPHLSTLNALSQIAFEKDWLSLKTELAPKSKGIIVNKPAIPRPKISFFKRFNHYAQYAIVVFLVALLGYLSYSFFNGEAKENSGSVSFSAKTSVKNQVPNTVVFDYDVSGVKANKFFIQQNWDSRRRVEVSKENRQQTDIYYLPGFYFAKLIADTAIIAQTPVHIKLDDWFIQAFQGPKTETFDKRSWLKSGQLGLDKKEILKEKLNVEEPYSLAFYNSREFNTDGDNFSLNSLFKMDSLTSVPCPKMSIIIKGEHDYFLIQLIKNGCESDAFLKIREKQISGKTNDLTSLGTNLFRPTDFKITVKDKNLTLVLNGKVIYQNSYQDTIGSLKEITYIFSNNAVLDEVELTDNLGKPMFVDTF